MAALTLAGWALAAGGTAAGATATVATASLRAASAWQGESAADPQRPESDAGLQLELLRSWAPDRGVTVVDGLATVPLDLLAGTAGTAYRAAVRVEDASGTVLYEDDWERQVSSQAGAVGAEGAALQETFRFGLKPGRYRVTFTAEPVGAPGMAITETRSLDAYEAAPIASDLILAGRIQPVDQAAGGAGWPITRSGYGIGTSVANVVLPGNPELYYYLELYSPEEEQWEGAVSAEIRTHDGRVVYRTPPRSVNVVAPGVPFTGQLSLAGLPPGEFDLVMSISGAEEADEAVRSAPFRMAEAAPELPAGGPRTAETAPYFASLSEQELDALFGGVGLMLSESGRRAYEELPPDARRRFLTEFFRKNDPDPLDAGNAFLDEYIERVRYIRSEFAQTFGLTEMAPWRTDRGRIYLTRGAPTDRLRRLSPSGGFGLAYEIWFYGQTTREVFLLVDENGTGDYRLFFSTDPDVQGLANWDRRVGNVITDILRDLQRFGVRPTGLGPRL